MKSKKVCPFFKEIENATDEVKRILSLEYSRKREVNKKLKKNLGK